MQERQEVTLHAAALFVGFLIGIEFYYIGFHTHTQTYISNYSVTNIFTFVQQQQYKRNEWKDEQINSLKTSQAIINESSFYSHDEAMHAEEDAVARKLAKAVRVLCWVMTDPSNHKEKAIHVKRTWGRRCNKLVFISTQNDTELPTVALENVTEGAYHSWAKTKNAWKLVYNKFLNDADFFMKTNDETYVVVENLRFMLKDLDPSLPIWFGCSSKPPGKPTLMNGGAGYVFSKGALKAFVEKAITDPKKCRPNNDGDVDIEMGICLENVGIKTGDSRDNLGRIRFLPFTPEQHIIPGQTQNLNLYQTNNFTTERGDIDGCSDIAITFHYNPRDMYVPDYAIYHLRPFGIQNKA